MAQLQCPPKFHNQAMSPWFIGNKHFGPMALGFHQNNQKCKKKKKNYFQKIDFSIEFDWNYNIRQSAYHQ